MNLIIIAGIKRSGSTVQYNLVRLALQMAGYNVIIRGHRFNTDELDDLGEKDVILLKRHPFCKEYAEKADHIFLTDRPDEEIIESLTKFNGIRPGQSHIDHMRVHLDKWKGHTDSKHLFHYWVWNKTPEHYTLRIIDILGLNILESDVLEAFNKIEPPESGQDRTTLLFSNHISNYEN